MNFYAEAVRLLHIALVIFVIAVPFVKNMEWTVTLVHFVTTITLLAHWILNNDACFLTLLECTVRGFAEAECKKTSFMYGLVSPVYKIADEHLKNLVVACTIVLGLMSFRNLYGNWDSIKVELELVKKRMAAAYF